MARLRAATRPQHERLNASNWFDAAIRDLDTYAQHIAEAEALYRDAERAFAPFAQLLTAHAFAPHERRKTTVLAAERAALHAHGFDGAARGGPFPAIGDAAAALGTLYVLEGSTLGGAVLGRRLRERLGWEGRFYGMYGERTAAMWRAFVLAADALGERLDAESMAAAAGEMFDVYGVRIAALEPMRGAVRA